MYFNLVRVGCIIAKTTLQNVIAPRYAPLIIKYNINYYKCYD